MGKSLVEEVFSSEYVRIFDLTNDGRKCITYLKDKVSQGEEFNFDNVKFTGGVIRI